MEEKLKDILAYNLHALLEKNINVKSCDDRLCDNEDCVLYRALEQYMKYEFDTKNKIGISFEMIEKLNK